MLSDRLHILKKGADLTPPPLFTNPFCYEPHPLCIMAAEEVHTHIGQHHEWKSELEKGKMFGVMVVERQGGMRNRGAMGELYYIAAFSGQLGGKSDVDGFVPPIFDVGRSAFFQQEMLAVEAVADNREERRLRSEVLQDWLFEQYVCLNANGEQKNILDIFKDYYRKKMLKPENYAHNASTHHIPSGTGECCAPKLLQYAYQHGLRPVCMAEFWVQATDKETSSYRRLIPQEIRHSGQFYPACQKKCRPLLDFMLQGLDVEQSRPDQQAKDLLNHVEVVYEDDHVVVVNKPSGLLSVPGRDGQASLADWMRDIHGSERFYFIHRLDQDTSGLLLIAKDNATYKDIQQQFIRHEVKKTYVALLDGTVEGNEGKTKLRMRPVPDDPPRQMIDPAHGKQAVTRWRVIKRLDGQTLVELYPDTGRTHQLRVHCAHPLGLNAPIHGDRLYGNENQPQDRLCLHAKRLKIRLDGKDMEFEAKINFPN